MNTLAKKALDKEIKKIQAATKAAKNIENKAKKNLENTFKNIQNLKCKAMLTFTSNLIKKKYVTIRKKIANASQQSKYGQQSIINTIKLI